MINEEFTQLCVMHCVTLGDLTPEDFENYLTETFNVRTKFSEEVETTIDDEDNTGKIHDLLFFVHNEDVGRFAIPRLSAGIRWWEDVVGYNDNRSRYSDEILEKYPLTW